MHILKTLHTSVEQLTANEPAPTQAQGGKALRLPEQPRAPNSVTNTEELRGFIGKNADTLMKKAKVFCFGNSEEARELLQELYPRMLIVLEHSVGGGIGHPWACAHQILARLAIDRYRKERRTRARIKRLEFPDSIPDEPPKQRITDRELEELCRALDSLPARSRQILVGIFLEGCKAKDIAESLGLSESRLSELKALALRQLQKVLA